MNRVFGKDGNLGVDGMLFVYRGYVVYYVVLKAAGLTGWLEPCLRWTGHGLPWCALLCLLAVLLLSMPLSFALRSKCEEVLLADSREIDKG